MKSLSKKWKILIITLIVTIVFALFFSSHYIQLALMEKISLREFIIKSIAADQNLNSSSPMYGSFFNDSWFTMYAVDILDALDSLALINGDAVFDFLIGPNQQGPVDQLMTDNPKYNVLPSFVIVHTAYSISKIDEIPSPLVDKISETIKFHQNATYLKMDFWRFNRPFLFETTRLLNLKQFINFTLQKQDVLQYIDIFAPKDRPVTDIFSDMKALEEISLMETGWANAELPQMTKNFYMLYLLSLWDNTEYGFHENFDETNPTYSRYYETTVFNTLYAILAYEKTYGTSRQLFNNPPTSFEYSSLISKVGHNFENILNFLANHQNRYGLFFDRKSEVGDKVSSLQISPTYCAVMLLKTINRMDFLEQTVRWPAQPTFVESIQDRLK